MEEEPEQKPEEPKKQLQSDRGGGGRRRRTAIRTGSGGSGGRASGRGWKGDYNDYWDFKADLPDGSKTPTFIWLRNELLRAGVRSIIEPVAKIIGETEVDDESTMSKIQLVKPGLVIFDLEIDSINPLELCIRLLAQTPAPAFDEVVV